MKLKEDASKVQHHQMSKLIFYQINTTLKTNKLERISSFLRISMNISLEEWDQNY